MIKSESEIWRSLPGIPGVEVSTLGNVRTLDRVVSSESMTRFTKGRVLKQYDSGRGYLNVSIPIDGKFATKRVHRLVAQTFIPNPDNFLEVNHKNCIRDDNRVGNLEWCSHSYNQKYRAKYGVPYTGAPGIPLCAVNLKTLEVSRFSSQHEASRALGANQSSINAVIKGKLNKTHGFWFTNADDNATDSIKRKLHDIGKAELKVK